MNDQSKSTGDQAKYLEIGKLTFLEYDRIRYHKITYTTEIRLSDGIAANGNHDSSV